MRRLDAAALRRLGLWAIGCGLMVLVACNEISSPIRPAGYGYTLIVSDVVTKDTTIDGVDYIEGETSTDTVDFKWPASSLPLRIWVEDTFGLPGRVQAAIASWQGILVYGEMAAEIVSDSTSADIILRGVTPPPIAAARPVRRLAASDAACEGGTDVLVSAPDHGKLWVPIRMYVVPKFAMTNPLVPPCLSRVTIHELGHALGLFQHSPNPGDIMYGFPTVDAPSEPDVATILWVYHQPTDLRIAPGPPPPDTTTTPPDTTPPDTVLPVRRPGTGIDPLTLLRGP